MQIKRGRLEEQARAAKERQLAGLKQNAGTSVPVTGPERGEATEKVAQEARVSASTVKRVAQAAKRDTPPSRHPLATLATVPDPATAVVRWLAAPDQHTMPTLEDRIRRPAWHRRAACRGMGTAPFFPELGGTAQAGRATCAICVVRSECLDYALEHEDTDGVWGGTTARERARMRRAAG